MRWAEGFIAVDWGTTNRRAYLIGGDGSRGEEFEDSKGALSVPPDAFPSAVAEIRDRLGNKPMLAAGMIGSNRGWIEAPYVQAPAGLDDIARALVWGDEDTAIVPGVFDDDRADVMRGEEVQLLGAAAAGMIPSDCLVCHPGTHNKWVEIAGGRITTFRTVMTGELFNLLKEHSILADLLAPPVEPGAAFDAGVRRGLRADDLSAELFSVRARVLLGKAAGEDAASYTSGLLIGGDVRIGLGSVAPATEVVVMGRPELTRLYAAALAGVGREAVELDGERCFVAGIQQIAERIE
ncbi:2-dehydro-3-deoxygalactonokinase [Sphingomonas sp.]|uniref:2-dehydro-3-deoxygalactonokinase n=1 Tax=Sphingomonas sp. TaxID=28214 RepID=UPI0017C66E9F|nr:2-dehydro-3-deoxygalactonokinase [Sphingomonas sp.]MBA3511888.1 2-dehydro-3-deoxygalactonokinase [Sphingomonas sp.]